MTCFRSVSCALVIVCSGVALHGAQPEPKGPSGVEKIRLDALALRPTVESELAKRFLDAAPAMPRIEPRTLLQDPATKTWYTAEEAARLSDATREALKPRTLDEQFYYTTRYGTPLAYARALDIVARCGARPGLASADGAAIVDYGYGGIGHLRMLAGMGARVIGLEVDPLLKTLYSAPGDQGQIARAAGDGNPGSITLLHGRFPDDEAVKAAKLGGFDLFISKNTLKSGYIHPQKPVDKRLLVDLGVSDDEFVAAMLSVLKPGGLAMIYNLAPAPSKEGEPYKHWAEGRSPFPREMLERAGFTVLEFDKGDSVAARAMARALGWDKEGMDVEGDLFAWYTLLQRPLERRDGADGAHPALPRAPADP